MHFSASDGGGRSVSIWDYYDVDDSVAVSGESSASFSESLSMTDSRRISGPGDVYAVQGYSGSGGYVGMNYIYARDASQTLVSGSSHLTPETLGVVQDVSIDDADLSDVVSTGDQGGKSAMQHAFVWDGSLDSRQTIDIDGGITTSQDSQMVGFLPTAFGTAGYMNVNQGPGTLDIVGEGAAVAVSSLDLAGPAEVDCKLATGTGNSAWAYGNVRSASSDFGAVGAGAGAGNVDLEVDLNGNLYIDGEAEAAGIGIGAIGVGNEISGTLAARTGDDGTTAFGRNIEASNYEGAVVAAAAAAGLGLEVDLQNEIIGGGAEAAGIGVAAVGKHNEISSGALAAGTGFYGTGAYGRDIEASNCKGAVVAAAVAGGLGAYVDIQNEFGFGGVNAAGIGVAAIGKHNEISSGTLAAGTGFYGAGAYGRDIEASNWEDAVVAAAAAGGLGAYVDIQNEFGFGGINAAGIGVAAIGKHNEISSGTLAAGTGFYGAGAYGRDIEASNWEGAVVAAAAAGGLDAYVDIQNEFGFGGADVAGIGVAAIGKHNRISSGTLAAGTGFYGAGAYGSDIEASNCKGAVVAAAAAGGLGAYVDLKNDFGFGGVNAAGIGVAAIGKHNTISSGTLAANAGFYGAGAYGEDIEAFNAFGAVGTVAGVGGLDIMVESTDGTLVSGNADAAVFGAGAAGVINHVSVGSVKASTGYYGTKVVAKDVDAFSLCGAAGTGVAAGNIDAKLDGLTPTSITGEGSAAGSGAVGFFSYAGADRLKAESGSSTSASGKGLTAAVGNGVAGAGAISATYDSSRTGSKWEVASVEGDITGHGVIRGNFKADTSQSANAMAKHVFACGEDVHLGSYADSEDGTSSSSVDTSFSGKLVGGTLKAYAGDGTLAVQKGRVIGDFDSDADAVSLIPLDSSHKDGNDNNGVFDIKMKAWTDDNGAHTRAKTEVI